MPQKLIFRANISSQSKILNRTEPIHIYTGRPVVCTNDQVSRRSAVGLDGPQSGDSGLDGPQSGDSGPSISMICTF